MNREAKLRGEIIALGDMEILPHDEFKRRTALLNLPAFSDMDQGGPE